MTKENSPLVDAPLAGNAIGNGDTEDNPQLALAALASMDNQGARKQIELSIEPLIDFQTDCFCKRFCGRNYLKYQCSLPHPIIDESSASTSKIKNKRSCEWGSASHLWMFDYLVNKPRLLKFTNRHGDSLYDYFFQIINSLAFFQRWKNWRLGSADIPRLIQNMGPSAVTVFKGIQQRRKLPFIAQQANLKLSYVECLAEDIIQHLSHIHAYHHLQLNHTPVASKTMAEISPEINENNESEVTVSMNITGNDESIVAEDVKSPDLNSLWGELSITEQFIIEAIVINKQAEETVLYALKTMDIRLKEGVLPEDTTLEMLHDFKTDSLIKLASKI